MYSVHGDGVTMKTKLVRWLPINVDTSAAHLCHYVVIVSSQFLTQSHIHKIHLTVLVL